MTHAPVYRSIIGVDVEGSTSRPDSAKAHIRDAMYSILDEALRKSGVDKKYLDRPVDRGDGSLLLIHPADEVPKTLLLGRLIPVIEELLAVHSANHVELPYHAFRLRAAMHAGEVHHDQRGPFGEAVDLTCRLLDAPQLKAAMHSTTNPLAVVVSDEIYRSIVRHDYDRIDHRLFHPVIKVHLSGSRYQGWLRMPPRPGPEPAVMPRRPDESGTGCVPSDPTGPPARGEPGQKEQEAGMNSLTVYCEHSKSGATLAFKKP